MRSADRQERPLFVWGIFQGNHALSRLILPQVIESCAEELQCSATSLVVIPMKKCEFFVGHCESTASVWWLASQVQDNAEDLKSCGQLVSSRPFRVSFAIINSNQQMHGAFFRPRLDPERFK
jgi:hypothetical protein